MPHKLLFMSFLLINTPLSSTYITRLCKQAISTVGARTWSSVTPPTAYPANYMDQHFAAEATFLKQVTKCYEQILQALPGYLSRSPERDKCLLKQASTWVCSIKHPDLAHSVQLVQAHTWAKSKMYSDQRACHITQAKQRVKDVKSLELYISMSCLVNCFDYGSRQVVLQAYLGLLNRSELEELHKVAIQEFQAYNTQSGFDIRILSEFLAAINTALSTIRASS